MSDTVIRVENISKLYRLGEVGTGWLAHDVNSSDKSLGRRRRGIPKKMLWQNSI